MTTTHDADLSCDAYQTFWIECIDFRDDAFANAHLSTALALGFSDFADQDKLTSYMKTKYNAVYRQALKTEAVKLAIKSKEVAWLIRQDADFDIYAFDWYPPSDDCEVKITIADKDTAVLFKMTFVGVA